MRLAPIKIVLLKKQNQYNNQWLLIINFEWIAELRKPTKLIGFELEQRLKIMYEPSLE